MGNMLGDDVACGKKSLVLRSPAPDPQHTHEHLPLPCKARGRGTMRTPAYLNTHASTRLAPDLAREDLDSHSQRLCSSLLHGIAAALLRDALWTAPCTRSVAGVLHRIQIPTKLFIHTKTSCFLLISGFFSKIYFCSSYYPFPPFRLY